MVCAWLHHAYFLHIGRCPPFRAFSKTHFPKLLIKISVPSEPLPRPPPLKLLCKKSAKKTQNALFSSKNSNINFLRLICSKSNSKRLRLIWFFQRAMQKKYHTFYGPVLSLSLDKNNLKIGDMFFCTFVLWSAAKRRAIWGQCVRATRDCK